MRLFLTTAAVILLGATAGFTADVLDGKAAKKMLFSPSGSEFVIQTQDFMVEADVAMLNAMSGMDAFKSVLYYGAVAVSPDDGIVHKATVATADYHSLGAAQNAAISECNGLREGAAVCVVAAHITPKKYAERNLQLSATATVAFKKTYLRGKGPKAFAISPSQGRFGISKTDDAAEAAIAICATDGAKDCLVVIQD